MKFDEFEDSFVTVINLSEDYSNLDNAINLMKLLIQHTNHITLSQKLVFRAFKYDKDAKEVGVVFWNEAESKHILERRYGH